MRISDWSSDVCSSDLTRDVHRNQRLALPPAPHGAAVYTGRNVCTQRLGQFGQPLQRIIQAPEAVEQPERSEEHTSELQSLMRISYAVFCLKKKTTQTDETTEKITQNKHNTSAACTI